MWHHLPVGLGAETVYTAGAGFWMMMWSVLQSGEVAVLLQFSSLFF